MLYHFHCTGDIALYKGAQETFAFGALAESSTESRGHWPSGTLTAEGYGWGEGSQQGHRASIEPGPEGIEPGPEGQIRKAQSGDAEREH